MLEFISLFGSLKEPEEPEKKQEEEQKSGFFSRMKQAVSRTRESFTSKIEDIVALTRTVDESTLEDLETALITSDIGVQTTTEILDALRERAKRQAIEGGEELRSLLKASIRADSRSAAAAGPRACYPAQGHVSGRRQRHRQDHHRAASWPPGAAPRTAPFCSAPPTRFAPRPSSSWKSGPPAAAWR